MAMDTMPVVPEPGTFEQKTMPPRSPNQDAMLLDSPVAPKGGDLNGHAVIEQSIEAPIQTSVEIPAEASVEQSASPLIDQTTVTKSNNGGGDVQMHEVESAPLFNGQLEASDLLGLSAPVGEIAQPLQTSSEDVSAAADAKLPTPGQVEQPTSDVRAEPPSVVSNTENTDAMAIDALVEPPAAESPTLPEERAHEPIISHIESSPAPESSDPHSATVVAEPPPAIESVDSSLPPATSGLNAIPETMASAQAAGQIRPRDDDEGEEPLAKRTKVTPENDTTSAPIVAPVSNAASTAIAPPVGLPFIAADFDARPMTKSQQRYLLDSVRKAKKIKAAIPFLNPVDPVAMNIPTYPTIVPNPMDLGTIEEKLKNNQYSTANALWSDLDLMVQNCNAFNGISHPVTQSGLNLRAYFNKLMQSIPNGDLSNESATKKKAASPKPALPKREPRNIPVVKAEPAAVAKMQTPKPTAKVSASKPKVEAKKHEPVLNNDGLPVIRRASESERPKREIIKPPPRDLPYTTAKPKKKQSQMELQFCEQVVMKEIKKAKNQTIAWPFMTAVDPVAMNIPTYHTVVKKPMDFGTVDRNLQNGVYNNAKQFYTDSKLVFSNCYLFNPATDAVNGMGHQLEAIFDEAWEKKDEWISANQPVSEPPSDEESDAESSGDEVEMTAEERMSKIVELQVQIAKLTDEMVALSNAPSTATKKKSQKKAKGESSKKRKASNTGTSGPAKASKPKKVAKVKKLSLDQKRYVSESIMMLDEANMRKAVQMIRNGVPKLKDVHDDELELDVDEIPDNVLQTLFKFVKEYRRANGTDQADDDDYDEPEIPRQSSGPSNRKKNKPMSAREQESTIAQVRQQLSRFERSGSEQGNDENDDSSEDESSSSEEE